MKILKIEFENINSLKGKHEIDFTKAPFTVSSLFAITGPTGSGKSTILDVISLALFNMVPRLGKISKSEIINKGALLTRNQKEASAKVTYESRSGIYASQWSISTNRNDNLRDYEMFIYEIATNKTLDCKKSDVPSKNEELIGLNYNQFVKSVLLAQGDFAQFLKARKEERGELLEKITGTGIYRQIGIRAYQKFKSVNSEIEEQQREINLLKNDLLEEQELNSLNSSLGEKTKACTPLEKSIEQLDRQILLKNNIANQALHITKQEHLKELAVNKLQQFETQYGEILKKHEQVQVFAEDLRKWQILDETCNGLASDIEKHKKSEEENLLGISSCLEQIKSFLQTEPETESIEASLQEFSKNVRKLQQQRDEKLNSYRNLQDRFHAEVREVPFKLNGNLENEDKKLKELKALGEKNLQDLRARLEDVDLEKPEAEKIRLRHIVQQGRVAQQKAVGIENFTAEISRMQKEEHALLPETKELPGKIELKSSRAQTLAERVKTLQLQKENEMLKANLEEHRHQLKEGSPCPLCGSTSHPYATDLPPKNDKIQQDLLDTQKALNDLEKQITADKTTFSHHRNRLQELQQDLQEKQLQLESQKELFGNEFSNLNPSGETWDTFIERNDQKLQVLEEFEMEKRRLKAILAGLPILKEIKEVLQHGRQIKEELDSLYAGKDIDTDCLELQTAWTGLQHQKRSLSQLIKDLDSKQKQKTEERSMAEKAVLPKLSEIDCKEIKEALGRLMPEKEYTDLRRRREELVSQKGQIEASLKTLKEQLTTLREKDVEDSAESLSSKMSVFKQELSAIKEECEELRRRQRNDLERRNRIAEIEARIKGTKLSIRRWEILNTLIGDATGKKFNDFAQDLSLSQLLLLANRRLTDLSDRYRIDKPKEDEDDSLVAIDDHMGGQRRSVKTLSGGETFILSLSMALALSDLASKNVEINSLFIDEGFGTLDPETLDQTLDTLEKLQAESSKTIGVISHVDSLKERIATQIKLTRNGQGYSSLEVTG